MGDSEQFTFEQIRDAYTEEIRKKSIAPKQSNAELVVHPSECVLTNKFQEFFETIRNFVVYPDDIWVITFPKCGTTWTQEMVWLLRNKVDIETAKSLHLRYRCPFMELETIITDNKDLEEIPSTIEMAKNLARPRCIKSHLPVQLLPKGLWTIKPKIVYVTRDPRDVAISYYHHHRIWNGYQGNLEDFTEAFLADRVVYAPYWGHILGFWNLKDKSHVLFNNFEEMKKDLSGVIRKTAKFLNVEVSEEEVEKLKQHLSFKSMKDNLSVNYLDFVKEIKKQINLEDDNLQFIRKGESGGWANTYSEEFLEKFKNWTEKHLKGTEFSEYPYSSKS